MWRGILIERAWSNSERYTDIDCGLLRDDKDYTILIEADNHHHGAIFKYSIFMYGLVQVKIEMKLEIQEEDANFFIETIWKKPPIIIFIVFLKAKMSNTLVMV